MRSVPMIGLSSLDHSEKLEAWIVRLAGARKALSRALEEGDRRKILSRLEDVQFWIGRSTAEAMSADPLPERLARAFQEEMMRVTGVLAHARRRI